MADFTALKATIQQYIKQNGNNEITGVLLQDILLSMVTTMGDSAINDLTQALTNEVNARGGADNELSGRIDTLSGSQTALATFINSGYIFKGVATLSTNPGTINGKVFYLTVTAGQYANMGNVTANAGISVLAYDGSAWSATLLLGMDNTPVEDSGNMVKSGGVHSAIAAEAARALAAETSSVEFNSTTKNLIFKNSEGTVLYQLAVSTFLNSGAVYAGYATPSTIPPALTGQKVFYVATQAGTYTHFLANYDTPIILANEGIYFLVSGVDDDDWNAEIIMGVDDEPTAGSNNLVKSGGVQNELALGAVYDVSAKNPTSGPNNDGKWESLSALFSDDNLNTLIPTSVRKGGMSIKFIQSSDNKYVQFRYMSSSTAVANFTNVDNWQGVDEVPTVGSKNLVESGGVFDKVLNIHHFGTSGGNIEIGECYYNTDNKAIKRKITNTPNYVTVPFLEGAIYRAYGTLFYWDGTNMVLSSTITKGTDKNKVYLKNNSVPFMRIVNDITTNRYNLINRIFNDYTNVVDWENVDIRDWSLNSNSYSSDYKSTDFIEVKPNTTYKINVTCRYIATFNEAGLFTDSTLGVNVHNQAYNAKIQYISNADTFTTGQNERFVRLQISKRLFNKDTVMMVEGSNLPEGYIPFGGVLSISEDICTFFKPTKNLVDWPTIDIREYSIWSGQQSLDYMSTDFIKIEPGKTYKISAQCRYIATYETKGNFTDSVSMVSCVQNTDTFTATNNSNYVRFQLSNSNYINNKGSLMLVEGSELPYYYEPFGRYLNNEELPKIANSFDILYGKKWVACGSSSTQGDFTGIFDTPNCIFYDFPYKGQMKVYPYYIGRRNYINVVNEAVAGSPLTYIDGTKSEFSTPNGRYTQIPIDADYITLMFGANDVNNNVPIGTIDDNVNTTFYGAWNVVLTYLIKKHPYAHIGIVVPYGSMNITYSNPIRNIAKKYGLPLLDLQNDYEHVPYFLRQSERNEYMSADIINERTFRNSVSTLIKCLGATSGTPRRGYWVNLFWHSGNSYAAGDFVIYQNYLYKCLTDNEDDAFDTTKWKLMVFSEDNTYSAGDIVIKDYKYYQANTSVQGQWSDNDWDDITWNGSKNYTAGDIAFYPNSHLNAAGQEFLSNIFESWLRSL